MASPKLDSLLFSRTLKKPKMDQNGPNQQVFKLNFEQTKRDIMDLDQQIGREIDLMVVKLSGLDSLKKKLNDGQERLEETKKDLDIVSSKDTWTKIQTTIELTEALKEQTMEKWQSEQMNMTNSMSQLPELQGKLLEARKTAEATEDIRCRSNQDIAILARKASESRSNLLVEKDESLCQLRNLVIDYKIQLQTRNGELRVELQTIVADHSQTQHEMADLELERETANQATLTLKNESHSKLAEVEQLREVNRTRQRNRNKKTELKMEQYNIRAEKLERQVRATQDQVDRLYCQLRAAEEVSASVKEFFLNIKREHRKVTEQLERVKEDNKHLDVDYHEKKLRIQQQYQEVDKKNARDVLAEETELDDSIDQIKEQETVFQNFCDENSAVEKSIWQVRIDEKEAEKMICRMKNRLYEEKRNATDVQERNTNVCAWKHKFQDSGITPHLYLERLRDQMQEMNIKIEQIRSPPSVQPGRLSKSSG